MRLRKWILRNEIERLTSSLRRPSITARTDCPLLQYNTIQYSFITVAKMTKIR